VPRTLRLDVLNNLWSYGSMKSFLLPLACAFFATACGSSYPEPKDAFSQSEAAIRGATEVGAEKVPSASLHLKFARDQVAEAKRKSEDGDNRRAEFVLLRARADAELALMLARTAKSQQDAKSAEEHVADIRKKVSK
jgi:hypothetical protein